MAQHDVRESLPAGDCSARNTADPDFGRGIHRGEALYENQGFIIHFFDRAKVEQLAAGFEIVGVDEFEEGTLPRRLFRVTMRSPRRSGA